MLKPDHWRVDETLARLREYCVWPEADRDKAFALIVGRQKEAARTLRYFFVEFGPDSFARIRLKLGGQLEVDRDEVLKDGEFRSDLQR